MGNTISPGVLRLGRVSESKVSPDLHTALFTCRKNSSDFLGQARVDSKHGVLEIEMFNDVFFENFSVSRQQVLEFLNEKILKLMIVEGHILPLFLEPVPTIETVNPSSQIEDEPTVQTHAHDLSAILSRLNHDHFEGKISAKICWGRESGSKNNRSFRFGSYDHRSKQIRIHPRLKQAFVPESVLELTVFHEMCHQWAPPRRVRGRGCYHHAEFKSKEREYPRYKEAREWEKSHWKKLLIPPVLNRD
jgi:hypothetical protein